MAEDPSSDRLTDRPSAFRWTWHLVSAGPDRIRFGLPLARLLVIGLLALLFGLLVLLHPEWLRDEPGWLVQLAGWAGVAMFVSLLFVVVTHRGELTIDAASRNVHLEFSTAFDLTRWSRPFEAFSKVRTQRVRDQHGLHNHWRIELVAEDGSCLMVGYGLIGAIDKRSRDRLSELIAGILEIPIEHSTAG